MQQCFGLLVWPHRTRGNPSDMNYMHAQWGGDHNPCYISNKKGVVTGSSGSMERAAVSLLDDVLHIAVIQIIGISTHDKVKQL